ncbi:MAG: flagellar basal body rod protein FlgB [Rhizobiaceae bacterium]|jgi:flagellar basal-body rod protein FlgB|nr:flagellar basal body rod protein FlgB [Rhizobiaceae bacterium]
MSEIYLGKLAGNHAEWLGVRQSLIASNVANANTPGFRAQDVKEMDESAAIFSNLTQTDSKHIASGIGNVSGIGTGEDDSWEIYHSGGNVSLPQEMMKASEVAGAYELNTTVMKTFHRMVVAVFGN